jgi:hypothetical protein
MFLANAAKFRDSRLVMVFFDGLVVSFNSGAFPAKQAVADVDAVFGFHGFIQMNIR